MADPLPTRLHIDPPMHQWQLAPRNGRATPVIATGHQPILWHPGILAKDIAADAIAKQVGGSALHVIVDHNPVDPLALDVPLQQDDALSTRRIPLVSHAPGVTLPPNRLPPIDPAQAIQQLQQHLDMIALPVSLPIVVRAGLERLITALSDTSNHATLAEQTTALLAKLKQPYLHQAMATLPTSRLVTAGFVDRLMRDPVGCVRCYNRAALAYPEARIRTLYVGREVVEVPLWAQGDGACMPVYADLGDSRKPLLFTHDQAIDLAGDEALKYLRPRAITLSAIMRSEHCDLFIHGTGGGVYDQVTERWWQDWAGQDLAPMAVVSADVYLPFDVPTVTSQAHAKSRWYAHHLAHNMDRYAESMDDAETALRNEKRALLDHMHDDRDKRRRASAFKRLHAINAQLVARHQAVFDQAQQHAAQSRVGLANAQIASRRDWFFALYPAVRLQALVSEINARLTQSARP